MKGGGEGRGRREEEVIASGSKFSLLREKKTFSLLDGIMKGSSPLSPVLPDIAKYSPNPPSLKRKSTLEWKHSPRNFYY